MEVLLSASATKEYRALPPTAKAKIKKKLTVLSLDPHLGKKLGGQFSPARSLRVWPYRIIYVFDQSQKQIAVLKIAHRQGVYK